ncbi:MAG: hypothetical protein JNK05_13585 [Myxococcales bacterium]|nr:hypothetical protein [Myxococcales bacterium]
MWLAPAAVVARLSIRWVVLALLTAFSKRIHRWFTYWMFADAVKTVEGRRVADELIADTQVMMRCYAARPIVAPTVFSDAELARIRVPTLLLIGENETVGSAAKAMKRVRDVAPCVRAELVSNAGHDLPIAQRAIVIERVIGFLSER